MKLLLLLCFFTRLVLGIYEDQLGKFDWHRRQIGLPLFVALSSKKPRLFTSTDAEVVANINLRDGEINWRQQLDDSVKDCFLFERENVFVTLTSHQIFAWDVSDGTQKWEVGFEDSIQTHLFMEGTVNGLLVFVDSVLEMRNPTIGGTKWTVDVRSKLKNRNNVLITQDSEFVYLIALTGKIEVLKISAKSGEVEAKFEVSLGDRVQFLQDVVSVHVIKGHFIFSSSKALCKIPMEESSPEQIQCMEQTVDDQILPLQDSFLKVDVSKGQATLSDWTETGFKDLVIIDDYLAHSRAPRAPSVNSIAILKQTPDSKGLKIAVLDVSTGVQQLEEDYPMIPASFNIDSLYLGNYRRKDSSIGFRYLLLSTHGEILLLQQGQQVWMRNEAPSGIKKAVFIDPPTHSTDDHLPSLTDWLKAQFLTLKVQFQLHSAQDRKILYDLRKDLSGKNLISKDANGCRKFIVVLSKYRTLLAVHNGNGRILWETHFPVDRDFDGITQFSYSLKQDQAPKILVYKTGFNQPYLVVDGHHGENLQQGVFLGMVSKVVKLAQTVKSGDQEQSLFLLMDLSSSEIPSAQLFPKLDTYPTQEIKKFVFWTSQKDRGILQGFGVRKIDLNSLKVEFQLIWSLSFHAPILLATERSFEDPVHSYTKVLGDRSLLFKYLNPNTALIVAGGVLNNAEFEDSDLEAFLIDTITGRVLYRQLHESAKGPVHGVISQHCAIYHYWSIANQRHQISSLEFYDASHRQLTLSDLFLKGILDFSEEVSSYKPTPVKVFNATYFTSVPVKTLEVTRTLRGITPQLLLMGTDTDQIYSMNKKLLDPRRPVKPNLETKDERLIPFTENLPISPTQYASYNHLVMGLKEVMTMPTGLESMTHVFSFGLDLYYVRLQPERGFDTLDEDFNFGFLLLTLLAMIIVSLICRKLVQGAKLSKKWK